MKAILRRGNVWDLTEKCIMSANFPTLVLGTQFIEQLMKKVKNLALSRIQLLVADSLLTFIATFDDAALA